jgi:cold shock CspA family protein
MKVPLELSFRRAQKTKGIEKLIREKVAKLMQTCNYMVSCRVVIEAPLEHQMVGNPFRVRIDIRVPPRHELVVRRESSKGDMHDQLPKVLRNAFNAARRQLKKLVERQSGEVKTHPQQQTMAFVVRLFPEKGYGFLKTINGKEVYFHPNSELHNEFDLLAIGIGVRFVEEIGEKGPQASTVWIVDKPGARISASNESNPEPPLGWEEQGGKRLLYGVVSQSLPGALESVQRLARKWFLQHLGTKKG